MTKGKQSFSFKVNPLSGEDFAEAKPPPTKNGANKSEEK